MSAGAELSAAVESCLEQIAPANGYETDARGVYGFGQSKPDKAPSPYLLVRIGEDQSIERVGAKVRRQVRYDVQGVFSRTASLQDMQRCHHDILRSLGYGELPPGRHLLRGEIIEESAEYDPDTDGSLMRSVVASITIQYFEQY